jgi:hypothetical protein
MKTNIHFWSYIAEFFLEWEMFQIKVAQKIKTQRFMFNNRPPPPPKIVPFMRECGKNIVEPGRPQMTIWRMRIECFIPKATNTHSEHLILFAFPLQQRLRERVSLLLYKYTTFRV